MEIKSLNRSGFASIKDLELLKEIITELEEAQNIFLKESTNFRSLNYKWPIDALHNWSRIWEYPYVYYHLIRLKQLIKDKQSLTVLDFGSGLTFFPFFLAQKGFKVICVDNDSSIISDVQKGICYLNKTEEMSTRLVNPLNRVLIADNSIDIVYCISVLEHINVFQSSLDEIHRLLKKGGYFILTIDIDLRGDSEIGGEKYEKLQTLLNDKFDYYLQIKTIHPTQLLTTLNSPYQEKSLSSLFHIIIFHIKQEIKKIVKRQTSLLPPHRLSVESFLLVKK